MAEIKRIEVSEKLVDTFRDWFPDCGGVIDTEEVIDLHWPEIYEEELIVLLMKLSKEGVEKFIPFCILPYNIEDCVKDMLSELDALGFNNEDDEVNGGDLVNLMGEWIPRLREALK